MPRGKNAANPQLGNWVKAQRYHFKLLKEGKSSPITNERDFVGRLGFDTNMIASNLLYIIIGCNHIILHKLMH